MGEVKFVSLVLTNKRLKETKWVDHLKPKLAFQPRLPASEALVIAQSHDTLASFLLKAVRTPYFGVHSFELLITHSIPSYGKFPHREFVYDSKSFAEVIISVPQLKISFHFQTQVISQRQNVRIEVEGCHLV